MFTNWAMQSMAISQHEELLEAAARRRAVATAGAGRRIRRRARPATGRGAPLPRWRPTALAAGGSC